MKQQTGFTLSEFLVCLVICSFILLGSLSIRQTWQNNQADIISRSLQHALQFSRNKAIARGESLILQPLSGTKDWSMGMALYPEHQTTALNEWRWNKAGVHIHWQGFQSDDYVIFSPHPINASSSGSFHISVKGIQTSKIIINRIGHIRFEDRNSIAGMKVSRQARRNTE